MTRILHGDSLSVLRTLEAESVQCVVTSPPYWGLRQYDIPDLVFDGYPACEHQFGDEEIGRRSPRADEIEVLGSSDGAVGRGPRPPSGAGRYCSCGAWLGQLGQEPTPDLYIAHMVAIFAEVRRVLRADGICWLNIGDCYANNGGAERRMSLASTINRSHGGTGAVLHHAPSASFSFPERAIPVGIKPKDLVGIPWLLAFALRADGWYLRAENIWAKGISFCQSYAGSVMPESVTDRPTRSHEQVFLLTKSERYFYDHEAVKEKGVYAAGTRAAKGSGTREGNRRGTKSSALQDYGHHRYQENSGGYATYDGTRNLRTVWAIGVQPFDEAHFATFPPDLVDPCLRAGTSQKGACAACGAPWERIVDYEPMPEEIREQFEAARVSTAADHGREDGFTTRRPNYQRKRIGEHWERTCECETTDFVPCKVLDPFNGSGTTGVAAELLRLDYVGIDLGYHEMAERRIGSVAPLFGVGDSASGGNPRTMKGFK